MARRARSRKISGGMTAAFVAVVLGAMQGRATAATVTEVNSGRPDVSVFLLEGRIEHGDTLTLASQVGRLPPNRAIAVILNSPGGDLSEGIDLGRFFHRTRITTFVLGYGGFCLSACSLAFLGGRGQDGKPSRIKMAGGALGFHQFYQSRSPSDSARKYIKADMEATILRTRTVALNIIQYLSDIGEQMSFLHRMLKAPAQAMNNIRDEEALAHGIHVMDERNEQLVDSASIKARIETR
jgi:hypothetical protein